MFVAYTGYGRIATMGEEVREPRRIMPRAILGALGISALLYFGLLGHSARRRLLLRSEAEIPSIYVKRIAFFFGWMRRPRLRA